MTIFGANGRVMEQEGMLILHRSNLQDSGKYVCIANNSKGQEQVHTVLTIKGELLTIKSQNYQTT